MLKSGQNSVQKSCSSAFVGQVIKSSLWHQRLGHLTNEVLSVMLHRSQISHVKDSHSQICSDCIDGKMSRLPFSDEATRSLEPFEKIHTDI